MQRSHITTIATMGISSDAYAFSNIIEESEAIEYDDDDDEDEFDDDDDD